MTKKLKLNRRIKAKMLSIMIGKIAHKAMRVLKPLKWNSQLFISMLTTMKILLMR